VVRARFNKMADLKREVKFDVMLGQTSYCPPYPLHVSKLNSEITSIFLFRNYTVQIYAVNPDERGFSWLPQLPLRQITFFTSGSTQKFLRTWSGVVKYARGEEINRIQPLDSIQNLADIQLEESGVKLTGVKRVVF
jgi:hypothetical protein